MELKKDQKQKVTKISFNIDRHITDDEEKALIDSLDENFGIKSIRIRKTHLTLVERLETDAFEVDNICNVDRSRQIKLPDEKGINRGEYLTSFKIKNS